MHIAIMTHNLIKVSLVMDMYYVTDSTYQCWIQLQAHFSAQKS